jgi:beta-1,4-mannosyltransferase
MKILASPAFQMREENPYTWLLYRNMDAEVVDYSGRAAIRGKYDILHFHWPEGELNSERGAFIKFTRLFKNLRLIDFMRARGTKVFWTVHNLSSHERRNARLEAWFWREFTRRLDGLIALSDTGLKAIREQFPALAPVPGYVIPHGHFRDEYQNRSDMSPRQALRLDGRSRVLLFFGQIREYKNVDKLVDTFRAIRDDSLNLCIAGRPLDETMEAKLRALAPSDSRIRLDLRHIPRAEVRCYFEAADIVVLPYREILNSGSAILALSLNRPVLVPRIGAMGELQDIVGKEWVRTYSGELSEQELLSSLEWAMTEPRAREAPLSQLEWSTISAETLQAFCSVAKCSRA